MALTSLPEEVAAAFAEMVVPCKHFQFAPRASKIPLGYCHRRQIEVPFLGRRCNPRCRMFDCGLFDPLKQTYREPQKINDPMTVYQIEIRRIRSKEKPNYFSWRIWKAFSGVVRHWVLSSSRNNPRVGEMSLSEQILCLPACRVKWLKNGLLKSAENQSIFEHLSLLLPKYGEYSAIKERSRKAAAAIDQYLSKSSYRGQIDGQSVVDRYRKLRDAENIPGD